MATQATAMAAQRSAPEDQYRCSSCHAPVEWDPGAQAMSCEFCGGSEPVAVPREEIPEYSIEEAFQRTPAAAPDRDVRRIRCQNCGATVDFESGRITAECTFCGGRALGEASEDHKPWKPESLLPFQLDEESARSAYREWLKTLWLRPSDLKSSARISKINGVYLAHWAFDAHVDTWFKGQAGHHYYVTRRRNGKRRRERRTRWSPANGQRSCRYSDVLVHAAESLPENVETKLSYPTENLVPYDARYLMGFAAEEYSIGPREGWERGKEDMKSREKSAASSQIEREHNADTSRVTSVKCQFKDGAFKHVLLPLWLAVYNYKGKPYHVAINGYTGELVGKAPWSVFKVIALIVGILAAVVVAGVVLGKLENL